MPTPSRHGRAEADDDFLVVLSNRLPYNQLAVTDAGPPKRNVGGLVNAVEPALAQRGGKWCGWDGSIVANARAVDAALASPRTYRSPEGIEFVGCPLSEREVARFYNGFCNRALWPLFHDFIGRAVFQAEDFALYERVNRRFAELALRLARGPSRIWVHDFHFMLVPGYLRELGFTGRIDVFLHIPFPPAEIFRALPWRLEILEGLLAADTVVFHVDRYKDNFVGSATSLLGDIAQGDGRGPGYGPGYGQGLEHGHGHEHGHGERDGADTLLRHRGRNTLASVAPIGIDVESFETHATRPEVRAQAARIRAAHAGRPILFSADRLDYTKGIRERMAAVEYLLAGGVPGARKVDLLQVVVPSRHQVEEYRTLKREIDRDVGRINGALGEDGWMPIHYRYRALDRPELVAHYLAASVTLVTPLRDGMNLVASEFVASRVDGDGVLVVSEFAGIAERLPGALLVNPYDNQGVAKAIAQALAMSEDERRDRMASLARRVRQMTASCWAERCLGLADQHASA